MNPSFKGPLAALILALGLVASAALLSSFFVRVRQEQAITVKGYAERDLVSDIGRFTCRFSARGSTLQEAHERLEASRLAVTGGLRQRGFADSHLTLRAIDMSKVMRRDAQGRETNEVEYFDASQEIVVTSGDVQRIADAASGMTDLIRDGIDISVFRPAFFVSRLEDTKLDLLTRATEDGYRRALALAGPSGGRVGALVSARQGVFQITERNSTETSDYGEYNTATIEKTAKAVVTLEYAIEAGTGRAPGP